VEREPDAPAAKGLVKVEATLYARLQPHLPPRP
jgi:hypothetical protein